MGDIGPVRKEVEFEPMPDDVPVAEPSPAPSPFPAPAPVTEPAPRVPA